MLFISEPVRGFLIKGTVSFFWQAPSVNFVAIVQRSWEFADPQSKVLYPMRKSVTGLIFAAFFCLFTHPGRAGDAVGELAPNWILPDSKGTPISLYEEVEAGKTIVMFFWASWCKSCKSLLPLLQKLDQAKGDRPISFYLMNVWEDDDPVAFLERYDLNLPVLLQAENVAQRYEIRITPGVVVVDPQRRIRYVRSPDQTVTEVTAELQRVLEISPTATATAVTPAVSEPAPPVD